MPMLKKFRFWLVGWPWWLVHISDFLLKVTCYFWGHNPIITCKCGYYCSWCLEAMPDIKVISWVNLPNECPDE